MPSSLRTVSNYRAVVVIVAACALLPESASAQCETHRLAPEDGSAGDGFGRVALSGDFAIVGAPTTDGDFANAGAAYLLQWDGDAWLEEDIWVSETPAYSEWYGYAVAADGDVAVIGVPYEVDAGEYTGGAEVYRYDGVEWSLEATFLGEDEAGSSAFGHSVAVSGDILAIAAPVSDSAAPNAGAVYVFRFESGIWEQDAELTASDAEDTDNIGWSVAIYGDRLLVGTPKEDAVAPDAGAAYLFEWDGSAWSESAKLTASDGGYAHQFGTSVSLFEDVALVGAPNASGIAAFSGAAYVYRYDAIIGWYEEAKVQAADGAQVRDFGRAVAIGEDVLVVGDPYLGFDAPNTGAVYGFRFDGFGWYEDTKLMAMDPIENALLGWSVAMDGDLVLCGAPGPLNNSYLAGSAYVFQLSAPREDCNGDGREDRCQIAWGEVEDCNENEVPDSCDVDTGTSDDCNGNSIPDECTDVLHRRPLLASTGESEDRFGQSLAMSRDRIVAGSRAGSGAYDDAGAIEVHRWTGEEWSGERIEASDAGADDEFGHAVAIYDDVVAVGAWREDGIAEDSGAVYIFRAEGGVWKEEAKLTASDAEADDLFGRSVALWENLLAVGATGHLEDGKYGAVYLFRFDGADWDEEGQVVTLESTTYDRFGISVSVFEDALAVGASFDDSADTSAGAVFVYRDGGGGWAFEKRLQPLTSDGAEEFGRSVSLYRDRLIVGARATVPGGVAAVILRDRTGNWAREFEYRGSTADDASNLGAAVAIGSTRAIAGAPWHEEEEPDSAALVVLRDENGIWVEEDRMPGLGSESGDALGASVAIAGEVVVAGAPFADGPREDSGGVFVYLPERSGPWFTLEPTGARLGCENEVLALEAFAIGQGEVAYQWRLDGVEIPGATGAVVEIDGRALEAATVVDVLATDRCGATVSAAARIDRAICYIRGDADGDGALTLEDVFTILAYMFESGPDSCLAAFDANGDRAVDISDVSYLLRAMFLVGPPPPPPYPACGTAQPILTCESPPRCD